MEKNIRTELQFSEEQLQEITGGCKFCNADRAAITRNQGRKALYSKLADISQHLELPDLAETYTAKANLGARRVQEAQNRINERERIPGHQTQWEY